MVGLLLHSGRVQVLVNGEMIEKPRLETEAYKKGESVNERLDWPKSVPTAGGLVQSPLAIRLSLRRDGQTVGRDDEALADARHLDASV